MRIEAYNQVNQMYQTNKAAKTQKTDKTSRYDEVQISKIGQNIQAVKSAVAEAPDIREELIAPLKTKIQSGGYEVSGESFASKLLEKYNEMR